MAGEQSVLILRRHLSIARAIAVQGFIDPLPSSVLATEDPGTRTETVGPIEVKFPSGRGWMIMIALCSCLLRLRSEVHIAFHYWLIEQCEIGRRDASGAQKKSEN